MLHAETMTLKQTNKQTKNEVSVSHMNNLEISHAISFINTYLSLRPKHIESKSFLVAYRKGRCIAQNVGCHAINSVPEKLSEYLKFENHERYTEHILRLTSGAVLPEGGREGLLLKAI